jgi:hypothetical protein
MNDYALIFNPKEVNLNSPDEATCGQAALTIQFHGAQSTVNLVRCHQAKSKTGRSLTRNGLYQHSDPFTGEWGWTVVSMLSCTQIRSPGVVSMLSYWDPFTGGGVHMLSYTHIHSLWVVSMLFYTQIHSLGGVVNALILISTHWQWC